VLLHDFIYHVKCLTPDVKISIEDIEVPNRNGIYKIGRFSANANRLDIRFSVGRASALRSS